MHIVYFNDVNVVCFNILTLSLRIESNNRELMHIEFSESILYMYTYLIHAKNKCKENKPFS